MYQFNIKQCLRYSVQWLFNMADEQPFGFIAVWNVNTPACHGDQWQFLNVWSVFGEPQDRGR